SEYYTQVSRSSQASLAGLLWNLVLHQLPTPLQVSGEKHVTLFDPHHNENLYEAHIPEAILSYSPRTGHFSRQRLLESTSMVMSPVDIQDPDLVRFPRFSRAHRLECDLGPGDVLFMPAFWWHEVRSRPDLRERRNLAVNFWYEPVLTKEFPCPECRLQFNFNNRHLLGK
ncbi:Bifunctional peptidase and arginyl-hydroxylase JMJD5, partial [Geodia barretti]